MDKTIKISKIKWKKQFAYINSLLKLLWDIVISTVYLAIETNTSNQNYSKNKSPYSIRYFLIIIDFYQRLSVFFCKAGSTDWNC